MQNLIDWSNANQGFVMTLLTLVYVATTLWLAWLARRQLRLATELEQSRTRPFVIFDLVVDHHFVFASVKNIGQTSAQNVRINVQPNVQSLLGGENTYPSEEKSTDITFIAQGVAMLAPQREIRAMMGFWGRVKSAHLELLFQGSVSYHDINGTQYKEPFIADLSAHKGIPYRREKDIEDVAKELENISRTLGHIATGFSKPLVRIMNETEYQKQEQEFIEEARRVLHEPEDAKLGSEGGEVTHRDGNDL